MNTDFEGRPVPENEELEDIIKVWEVEPHPQSSEFDSMYERSWQNMLDIVRGNLDSMLERFLDDGDDEVKVTFRIVSMPKRAYLEAIEEMPS